MAPAEPRVGPAGRRRPGLDFLLRVARFGFPTSASASTSSRLRSIYINPGQASNHPTTCPSHSTPHTATSRSKYSVNPSPKQQRLVHPFLLSIATELVPNQRLSELPRPLRLRLLQSLPLPPSHPQVHDPDWRPRNSHTRQPKRRPLHLPRRHLRR